MYAVVTDLSQYSFFFFFFWLTFLCKHYMFTIVPEVTMWSWQDVEVEELNNYKFARLLKF